MECLVTCFLAPLSSGVLWHVSQHLVEVYYKNLQTCWATPFQSKQWAGRQNYGDCIMKDKSS